MKGAIHITHGRSGTRVRATGSAAQALFDALTKPRPAAAPAAPQQAPAAPEPRLQIGPLDV